MALTTALGQKNITTDVVLASGSAITPFAGTGPVLVLNSTPTAGGITYTTGDILTITGGIGATCSITQAAGVVQTVTLLTSGTGYTAGSGKATTVSPAGGTGCTVDITSITPPTTLITVHSIVCAPISTAAGVQSGHVSLRDGTNVLARYYAFYTATAASQGHSEAFPVGGSYTPVTGLNVLYTAVTDATTAAVSVVWSRR